MGATFSRLKNWIAEVLTYSDLNAEIDNILMNLGPAGVDDYSTNVAQMKLQTDPGALGSESLANALSGEIERLRYAISRLAGEQYWYTAPDSSISELASALGGGLSANRISSGREVTGMSQPIFLVPHGTNRTVTVKGATTPFVYYINGVQYTISTDVVSGTLVAAPSSNNTCAINDATLAGGNTTKIIGEYGTVITVDAMGSEISNLAGKLAGFKVGTEYFIAKVDSATQLSHARRGFFFDSADANFTRVALTDNDVITLQKLTWIFAKTDGTLTQTYSNPRVSVDEPSSPSIGDYWFDINADIWKYTLDGATWIDAGALLIGISLQDTSGTKAARSFDLFKNFATMNTVDVEKLSNTEIRGTRYGSEANVYGSTVRFLVDTPRWDIATDLDTGVVEAPSTIYYLYLTEAGDTRISNVAPHDRQDDLKGRYHPAKTWRAVGEFFNDASSNIYNAISYTTDPVTPPIDTKVVSKTTTYTAIPANEVILVDASAGAVTINLYSVLRNSGKTITITKTDSSTANFVTIDGDGSETINGSTTTILHTPNESVTLRTDGTSWKVIARRMGFSSLAEVWVDSQANATTAIHTITRSGNRVFVEGTTSFTGAATNATDVTIPTYLTASATAYPSFTVNLPVGDASLTAGGTVFIGKAFLTSTTNLRCSPLNVASTYLFETTATGAIPGTWANNDRIRFFANWIVTGWNE